MKKRVLVPCVIALIALVGCKNHEKGSFDGHTIGETYVDFAANEHIAAQAPVGTAYTGRVECFETPDLGDKCGGKFRELFKAPQQRSDVLFDNGHFTFVDGTLVSIESVGAGGIIGDSHQNWNWNLYLSELKKRYGKADKMTATDALWIRSNYVVHAYLTFQKIPYTSDDGQDEHVVVEDRKYYEQEKR